MIAKCLFILPLLLQAGDEIDPEAGEFNVFLFCIVMVALMAFCLLVAIGLVVGLLVAAAGFFGIMANAIISGLAWRSPKVGVTVLTLQLGGLIGLVIGASSCVSVRWALNYHPLDLTALLVCGALGAALGSGVAWTSLSLTVAAVRRIKEYCDSRMRKSPQSFLNPPPAGVTDAAVSLSAAEGASRGAGDD